MLNLNAFDGLTKVYHEAGEREIRFVVMYVKSSKLCVDAEGETEADIELVRELAEKGFLRVFDTDTTYSVASVKDEDTKITVGYGSKTVAVPYTPGV